MPFELDLRHEALNYVGRYARPTLELWGSGGVIINGLPANPMIPVEGRGRVPHG